MMNTYYTMNHTLFKQSSRKKIVCSSFFVYTLLWVLCFSVANCKAQKVNHTVVNDSFHGTVIQPYWRVNQASATISQNEKLLVDGGDGSFNNFIEYSAGRLPFEEIQFSMLVVPQNKNASSYGVSLYADSDSILYGSSLEVNLDLTDGANSGMISIGYNHTVYSTSASLGFVPGDSIQFSMQRNGWEIIAVAKNLNSNQTVSTTFRSSTGRGSGGYWRIAFLGGSQHICSASLNTNYIENPRCTVIGNSITSGSGASVMGNRYCNQLFDPYHTGFETLAFPSVKSVDVLRYLDEMIAIQPQYAVVSVGTNDRNQFIDTAVFRSNYDTIVRKLKEHSIQPVLLTLVPSGIGWLENLSAKYNLIIKRIGQEQQVKVVDINPVLKNSSGVLSTAYSVDQVHPNDSGHYLLAQFISQMAPELNNLTSLPVKFRSFTATKVNKLVELVWKTSNEEDVSFFEAERSIDGTRFLKTIRISKTGSESGDYQLSFDNSDIANADFLYYRIKSVYQNGNIDYSYTLKVQNKQVPEQLRVYPNPAHRIVIVVSNLHNNKNSFVEVTDVQGKKMTVTYSKSGNEFIIDVNNLPMGIYLAKIYNQGNTAATTKFVVQ